MARTGTQFAKITGDYSNIVCYGTWQLRSSNPTTKKFTVRLRGYLSVLSSATFSSTTSTFKSSTFNLTVSKYSGALTLKASKIY